MDPLTALVAMPKVADVRRSIAFYEKLGFTCANSLEHEGHTQWAWLSNGRAHLMLSRTEKPLKEGEQDVMLYLYSPNLKAYHAELAAKGIEVGEISFPFYMPGGEFTTHDPDGYPLMIGQADESRGTP